jgi:predicted phage replisome organizer
MINMRERKYIKFRIDMYEDTKFKIIDMKPERDLIHYVWTRFVALAGKSNLEGELYMSKSIPYTIETLAIEFNRDINQIKLAVDIFMELEMIELSEDNVYSVKNFVKHQNIKVKETIKTINKISKNKVEDIKKDENCSLEIHNKDINETEKRNIGEVENKDNGKIEEKDTNNIKNAICDDNIPIVLDEKKKKQSKKKKPKKKNTIDFDEFDERDNSIIYFFDGDEVRPLGENESVVGAWSFG